MTQKNFQNWQPILAYGDDFLYQWKLSKRGSSVILKVSPWKTFLAQFEALNPNSLKIFVNDIFFNFELRLANAPLKILDKNEGRI